MFQNRTMQRPKLKDSLYGEMVWEDWDEDEAYWYAPMKNENGDEFSLFIRAYSPADFMTVGGTHSTYRRLLENINVIRSEMVDEVMENSRKLFIKKRQRRSAGEVVKKNLKLYAIKIYADLSSEVEFTDEIGEDEDLDEILYALVDNHGKFTEAGVSKF